MESGFPNPTKYNRFYVPIVNLSGTGQYKLSSGEAQNVADAWGDYFQLTNGNLATVAGTDDTQVSVVSNSGTGYQNPAIKVRVGDVIDTQRRRRNKINETYAEFTV